MALLLALDQGTSSSRSIVFDESGTIVAMAQREFRQIYPASGWVEHDPREIWTSQLETAREVIAKVPLEQIAGLGITNQRETTVVWDRRTGEPVYNAIVWQDRRSEPACADLRARGLEPTIRERTGLIVDAYFSGTKLKWILDHVDGARANAEAGHLAFGTIDTWLVWMLTNGRLHVTDVSNASRTMMFNIRTGQWDPELLKALDIPPSVLPQVHPSSHLFGDTDAVMFGRPLRIGGIAGDQQSALFGQACFSAGMSKNTYGTGCFMLMHTGSTFQSSDNGLVSTAAAQPGPTPGYALEGSVFIGGAVVQWLRDGLGIIKNSADVERLASTVPDAGGVVLVPAFTGLGAPYWRPNARGAISGITRATTAAHLARAALESIAYQSTALFEAMRRDAVSEVRELRVDGGACANNLLMQFQADLLGIPVVRPRVIETTALGAAYLAGLACGVYQSLDALSSQWKAERTFEPAMRPDQAHELMHHWNQAVELA